MVRLGEDHKERLGVLRIEREPVDRGKNFVRTKVLKIPLVVNRNQSKSDGPFGLSLALFEFFGNRNLFLACLGIFRDLEAVVWSSGFVTCPGQFLLQVLPLQLPHSI